MKASVFLAVLASILVQLPAAKADPRYYQYQKILRQRAERNRPVLEANGVEGSPESTQPAPAAPTAQKLDQLLDHFAAPRSAAAAKKFKQRYFVDAGFAAGRDSPVIIEICGEAECEGASSTPLMNTIAQKYKGYRVALEHRYYGQSLPFTTLTTANLKYLSMDQAIEDLAYFQKFLQAKMGLTGKWIVIGGSYAGELAAFYRLKHPELVVGALASSGPVLSKADFLEYDQHVATQMSPACLAAVKTAVSDIEDKLQNETSAAQIKRVFKATAVKDNRDFLYVVADMAGLAIQYGYQQDFCDAITAVTDPAEIEKAYAAMGNQIFGDFETTALGDSFGGLTTTSTTSAIGKSGMRQWMYQSCTEFGYYQIANPNTAESARSQQITLDYHNEACKRMFGITTPVDTEKTNRTFFNNLASPSVTHIFFTNGSVDPWSTLSLDANSRTASANPNLDFYTIAGAAHCDDLGDNASAALTHARSEFDTLVGKWLTE